MQKEHAFRQIIRDFDDGTFDAARLVVFFGRESFLSRWAEEQAVEKYVDPAVATLDYVRLGPEAGVDEIISHCETLPLTSVRRVVTVTDSPLLTSQNTSSELKASRSAHDTDRMSDYIENVPDSTLLIFESANVDKRKALYKKIAKVGSVYEFDTLNESDLRGFLMKRIRTSGKTVPNDVLREIIDVSGYFERDSTSTLYDLENDIRKVIAHSEDEAISMSDVAAVMQTGMDTNVFAMLDAVSSGRKDIAFEVMRNVIGSGESAYRMLALMAGQLEIMLSVKEMSDRGASPAEMKTQLGVHEFRIKKALGFVKKYSMQELEKSFCRAFEIDRNIKTGLYPEGLALEMFISSL